VCEGCPPQGPVNGTINDSWTCQHCYYRHPDPVDDPFFQGTVKTLMYFCATILLLVCYFFVSYLTTMY
jgi:Ca2+:H+ antiporter